MTAELQKFHELVLSEKSIFENLSGDTLRKRYDIKFDQDNKISHEEFVLSLHCAKSLIRHNQEHEAINHLETLEKLILNTTAWTEPTLLYARALVDEERGKAYRSVYKHSQSAENFYKAGKGYESLGLWINASDAYHSAANFQLVAQNYDQIFPMISSCCSAYLQSMDSSVEAKTKLKEHYNIMGLALAGLHLYDSALHCYSRGLGMAIELEEEFWAGLIMGNMAGVYLQQGAFEKALEYLEIDYAISMESREWQSAANASLLMARIYREMNDLKSMQLQIDRANYLCEENGLFLIKPSLYRLQSYYHEKLGNYEHSLKYLQLYNHVSDSIQKVTENKRLLELQKKFDFELATSEIHLMQKNAEISDVKHRQAFFVIVLLAIIALMIALYSISKFRYMRKLREMNAMLDDKVRNRTAALVQKNQELNMYLYHASHDIRRPIVTMEGLTDLMGLSTDIPELHDLADKCKYVAKTMDSMLSKVHYLHLLDQEITYEDTNVSESIDKALDRTRSIIRTTQTKIHELYRKKKSVYHKSNPELLMIAISAIVENACLFSHPEREENEVWIDLMEESDKSSILIMDNGIGISPEIHEQIFKPFTRLSERSAGNGLGLYLCFQLVKKLGGMLTVSSTPYEGSSFQIHLYKDGGH